MFWNKEEVIKYFLFCLTYCALYTYYITGGWGGRPQRQVRLMGLYYHHRISSILHISKESIFNGV